MTPPIESDRSTTTRRHGAVVAGGVTSVLTSSEMDGPERFSDECAFCHHVFEVAEMNQAYCTEACADAAWHDRYSDKDADMPHPSDMRDDAG